MDIRNRFALTNDHIKSIYQSNQHLADYFILSTCNRTEIYSATQQPEALISLFCTENNIAIQDAKQFLFVKEGDDAVKHLFHVAAGLDSQIIGDYEIIGQLKNAFQLAKTHQRTSGNLEKIFNYSLQASRQVKNRTSLSDGTTSVSYAAIQLLKQKLDKSTAVNICLLGLGKIGTLTLKNLKSYLPKHTVTVVNRNEEKALHAVDTFGVQHVPFQEQNKALQDATVLVVATGADQPIILKKDIENSNVKLIFDLSVPFNVAADVKELPNVQVYNIDELSEIVNQSLQQRLKDIPLAETIVDELYTEYKQWVERRKAYQRKTTSAEGLVLSGQGNVKNSGLWPL